MTATDATTFREDPAPIVAPIAAPVETAPIEAPIPRPDNRREPPMRLLALPAVREGRAATWLWSFIAIGVATLHLYALLSFWAPAHSGVDQNGYFVGARQFAQTLSSGLKPESDFNFIGRMWVTAPSGVNYPKYPLGLPIVYAILLWTFGERGHEYAHLVTPVSAALASLGIFAIARRLSGGFLGIMAMLLFACGQTMLTLSVTPLSHAACTLAVVWGMFLLLRWLQTGSMWRGVLAGLLFGIAYMIRYTEGLLLLPMGVAMLYAARWTWPSAKRLAITAGATLLLAAIVLAIAHFAGGKLVASQSWLAPLAEEGGRPLKVLVGAVAFAAIVSAFIENRSLARLLAIGFAWLVPVAYLTLFNMVAMGSFTSYASTNESTGFSWGYFHGNWEKMIRVIHDQGLFFIAPLGVLGLALMFRRMPLVAAILLLWFVPSVLLYTAYYWAPDNMGVGYSRFIVSQLPALLVAAVWLMGELARRPMSNVAGRVAIGVIVFISCSVGLYRTTLGSEWGQRINPRASIEIQARQSANLAGLGNELRRAIDGSPKRKAARTTSDDSDVLVFSEGERLNHLQWIGGWQLFDHASFNYERTARQLTRTINEDEPDPIDPSRIKFLQELYKGKDQRALQADLNAIIGRGLEGGERVYFVLTDAQSKVFGRQIDRRRFDVRELGSFNDVPSPRLPDDFLLPHERPKQPVNRWGGRGNAFGPPGFLGNERNFYRIGQVVLKPTAATSPATTPATQP